ncbi:hypothetical protein [Pseudoxanthomonas putridarboris]|uniref:PEP-CTERM protein-sorting domain-containing protein n=1 Tax=Pseudoxanthomonas putridarboris TaxID=752605 RepID=A0ABU9J350_9GAMM
MALDLADFLELFFVRRIVIPLGVAAAIGIGIYYLSGKTPTSAAVAFGIGIIGLVIGVIWHIAGGSKSGAA